MGYHLRQGLSACVSGGRTIFLDVVSDRYLALPAETDATFQKLFEQGVIDPDERELLLPLMRRGLILENDQGSSLSSVVSHRAPRKEIRSGDGRAQTVLTARSVIAQTRMLLSMRRHTLDAQFKAVAASRSRLRPSGSAGDERRWVSLRTAFDKSAALRPRSDRCLVSSLAFLDVAFSQNLDASLVMGVVAAPFSAHCWVQVGETVVNDRLDYVRSFTPILTI
jgi:hypothetical protein